MEEEEDGAIVSLGECHAFIVRCMTSLGVSDSHCHALADLMVAADYRGMYSHGLIRLDMYVKDIIAKTTLVTGEPEILKETVATALVQGNNILGPVIGKFSMDLAIQKAKKAGIGIVSARASNHFGIAGWYGLRAVEAGMIGLVFCNTSPIMAPTRAKQRVLGTNPLCVAAPGKDGDSFVLDMATTSVALGKIWVADKKGEAMPEGWALDVDGHTAHHPKQMHSMCPLGGVENTSGYKGYGLAMMVETMCGILSGDKFAHQIKIKGTHGVCHLSQCFIAIDPAQFAEGFEDRMTELMDYCRGLTPVDGAGEVLVAGDPERKHMAKCNQQGGIHYHPNMMKTVNEIAARLNVAPMKTL